MTLSNVDNRCRPRAAIWLTGARPRTLPAAIAPVAVGTGVAVGEGAASWWRACLALVVALALQIGVNFANDYSDGVRGVDDKRVGPQRLVAGGLVSASAVLIAAWASFALAAVVGLVLVAVTGAWWLLGVGALAIVAAWTYTGGPVPYGYRALGELGVFLFFGLVAVVGTTYVQIEQWSWLAVLAAVPVGLLACALLLVNNLRDIPTDAVVGKRTLAVVLGDRATRWLYVACIVMPFVVVLFLGAWHPWSWLALATIGFAIRPWHQVVIANVHGAALIPVLRDTGRLQLCFSLLFAIGLAL